MSERANTEASAGEKAIDLAGKLVLIGSESYTLGSDNARLREFQLRTAIDTFSVIDILAVNFFYFALPDVSNAAAAAAAYMDSLGDLYLRLLFNLLRAATILT